MRPGRRITTVSHQLYLQNYLRSAPESRPARTDVCGLALLLPDPRAQEEGPDPARPGGATSPRLQRAGPDPSRLSQSSTRSIHLQAAISGKEQDEQQPNKTFAFVEAQPTPLTAHSYNKINWLSTSPTGSPPGGCTVNTLSTASRTHCRSLQSLPRSFGPNKPTRADNHSKVCWMETRGRQGS